MFERINHMLIKEFIQVFRDPRMRIVIFVIPCVQVLVIGYAVSTDVKHVRTAVVDLDNSQPAATWSRASPARAISTWSQYTADARRAAALLDRGDVSAVLRINHGFAEDLRRRPHRRRPGDRRRHRLEHGAASCSATRRHRRRLHRSVLVDQMLAPGGRSDLAVGAVDLRTRAWFNENLESRNFFVPGVMVVIVMLVDAAADQHGRGAREGDRHDGADHGHADHARWSSSSARRAPFA